ncbi:glycerophosphodiester phosphodiesterase [Nocardioides sp. ChNu-99]|uniref:glycerophosphodiester phosphodiesterase n=1 Tax=Nocardioides sp. ChNu-99 TaxID=2839897 RepID=UPI002404FD02|nr:glycerophosphodiester phosphodiesterase [Nocardioides sp. ChNu-99]MDF9717060.1 glycerophosphodiester phosphodiesterase [Nocardioides sp. ChNu-99]
MTATTTPVTGFAYLDGDEAHPGAPLAFAHRGGAAHPAVVGHENTLEAFEHAAGLGYVHLETDVQVTADGVLVAFHDALLERVTGTAGAVGDLTLAEVRRLRVGERGTVPTLAELVERLPGARFNIDLKCDRSPEALAAFVAEHDLWDRVLVGSFSAGRIRRFRRLVGGRVPTAAHRGEIVAFVLLPGRVADRLTGGRVAALQVPVERVLPIVSARLVRRAHATGKHVHVWTIDDRAEMEALLDLGVDGLMTDRTDVLREVLLARGAWGGRDPRTP